MKIVKLSQENDREAWLDFRRTLITGTKAKAIKPLSRGKDRTPVGFWDLLAENLAIAKDGEPERDRGLRLENEAITKTAKLFKLDLTLDPGIWVSDKNNKIAISPDSAEKGDKPTYAVEAKCLDSKNHIKAIVLDRRAKASSDYHAFDSIPTEYREQVIQYFAVNEHLKTLYFSFYDDRIVIDKLMHHTIVINRPPIAEEIKEQTETQIEVLDQIKELIKELRK